MKELPPSPLPYYGYPEQPIEPDDPNSGTLLSYWKILRRRKGAFVLISFLGALAGFLFTLPQNPVYQARLSLEVQGYNENFLNMQSVNPTTNTTTYYPEYDLQTQVRILQSQSLLERVVKKLDLENKPLFKHQSRVSAWREALGLKAPVPRNARELAIGGVAASVKVRAQANTRLLELTCDSTDPQLAADFSNTLAQEFIESNLEARWQTTQHTGEWLTRQLEDLKIKLEESEEQLQAYARSNNLLFTSEKDNIADQKLRQLQGELLKAQAERVARQARYELAAHSTPESLPEILDDGTLKEYKIKLTDLRRQRAELAASFTPVHPRVKKVDAQISILAAEASVARDNIIRRIENDYNSALRREKLLSADFSNQARLMTSQADQVAHYNILKREVDTNRQLYDNMLQRVKEAGIASALRASNIRVVDPAEVPTGPYKPNLRMNALLGLMAGGFLGVVFIVFRERADRTIQEPGDSTVYLNLPELGVIPSANAGRRLILRYYGRHRDRRLIAGNAELVGIEEPSGAGFQPAAASQAAACQNHDQFELTALRRNPSAVAESFRTVLASILFGGENGDRPRVLVLSSPNPKDGKTSVSTNLAISLAKINRRVLLIDGDLRKPRIHEIFGIENNEGLSDILARPESLNGGPVGGVVQAAGLSNLYLLPSGSSHETGCLYSPRLPELLKKLRNEFDTVVIDTPPMLHMADARVIGRAADAVILVIHSQKTMRDAALLAARRFSEDGTRILGTILNNWNPSRSSSYGYYKYYDQYEKYYRG